MSDNKKYYYLKLKDNFFETDEMIVLQNMQDGYLYSDILLKLYLRGLKANGKLMFKDFIPYNATILAQIVRHSVGVVEKAIKIFQELGLIEILDNGAIYLIEIQNFIGQSSTEADRIREYRKKIEYEKGTEIISEANLLQMYDKSTPENILQMYDKSTPEIEIEIEKDIDINNINIMCKTSKKFVPYKDILELFNSVCSNLPKVLRLTNTRKASIKSRWLDNTDIKIFEDVFNKVQQSDFLSGRNGVWTNCNFDWIIKESNWTKIQEGNYTGTTAKKTPTFLEGKTLG